MTVEVSPDELQAAIDESGEILRRLLEKSDPERAAFVLVGALQLIHAFASETGRAALEDRIRHLLTAMYQTPAAELLIARGGEFRINKDSR